LTNSTGILVRPGHRSIGRGRIIVVLALILVGALAVSQRASAEVNSPWGATTSYPVNVTGQSCVTYSGYIYCVGGYIGQNPSDPVYYAPISSAGVGTWVRSSNNYPISVYDESCVVGTSTTLFGTTASIICVGGETNAGGTQATSSVYAAPGQLFGGWALEGSVGLPHHHRSFVQRGL
jgi:hypothetical protein